MSLTAMSSESNGHNPIDRVICQINFPAMLVIGEKISDIQQMILEQYPYYSLAPTVKTSEGMPLPKAHVFSSTDRDWEFTLSVSSVVFVCYEYKGWIDFIEHVEKITSILSDMFEVNKLTRVGLRYVNAIKPSQYDANMAILDDKFANIVPEGNISFNINMVNNWGEIKSNSTIARIIFNENNEEGILVDIDVFCDREDQFDTTVEQISSLHQKTRELFKKYTSHELQKKVGFHE